MSTSTASASFLINCENCSTMIARDSVCPNCRHDHATGDGHAEAVSDCIDEFARRHAIHRRNVSRSMLLRMALGFIAMVTAGLWALVIYRGNIGAFFAIGILTVISGCLGYMVVLAEKRNRIDLHCPGCETRLDELNIQYDNCPACDVQLS